MIDVELIREVSIGSACLVEEFTYLLPPLLPSLSVRLLYQKLALAPGSDWRRCWLGIVRWVSSACMREQPVMRCKRVPQRFAQVTQKVPTIGNLNGLRSSPPCSFGVDPTTVATDDLGTWMSSQPRSYGVGVAIRKQVNHPASLEVTQDRSIAMALAPCPVVDPEYAWGLNQRLTVAVMKLTQQRRPAGQQAKTLPKPRPGSTAQGKRQPAQCFA